MSDFEAIKRMTKIADSGVNLANKWEWLAKKILDSLIVSEARAEAAEARCARLATALHKAREVRKGLVYWAEQFLIYEDGKRAWRLLKEMEDALSDAAQQETGDGD